MTKTWSSSLHRSKALSLFLVTALSISVLSPASASRGGTEDRKNRFTVGFTYNIDTIPSVCSGILIAPKIVVTAKHCVVSENGVPGTDYVFTNPGTRIDGPAAKSKIKSIALGDEDIAFITLSSSLENAKYLRIADKGTVEALADGTNLIGHGYGAVFETASPYSIFVRTYPLEWRAEGRDPEFTNTYELTSSLATACHGDSGGPIVATLPNGESVLIAIISGAASVEEDCGTPGVDGLYRMKAVLVGPHLGLVPEYSYPTPRLSRIVCVKGSKKKVMKGVKPKCPKGYRVVP